MRFFILAFIAVFSLKPLAQVTLNLEPMMTQTVDDLIAQGFSPLGPIDLYALRDEIASIEVVIIDDDTEFPAVAGDRRSAFHLDGTIYARAEYVTRFPESIRFLATHDSLDALGFQDQDYRMSSIMEMLATGDNIFASGEVFNFENVYFGFENDSRTDPDGGATGVGGGGDALAGWFKFLVLQELFRQRMHPVVFIDRASEVIEPQPEFSQTNHLTLRPHRVRGSVGNFDISGPVNSGFPEGRSVFPEALHMVLEVPTQFLEAGGDLDAALREAVSFYQIEYRLSIHTTSDDFELIGRCGNRGLVLHKDMLEHPIFVRSSGRASFFQNFVEECNRVFPGERIYEYSYR